MTDVYLGYFCVLSVFAFGAVQLLFWLRDRKAGTRPRYRQDWWRIKAWSNRDWLGSGFFMGYACAILVYFLSGLFADFLFG